MKPPDMDNPMRAHERAALESAGVKPIVFSTVARCLGPLIQPEPCAQCHDCERNELPRSSAQPWIAPATWFRDGEWTACFNWRFHDRNGATDAGSGKALVHGGAFMGVSL